MDEGAHRENGRHKGDQYKTAQGQVFGSYFLKMVYGDMFIISEPNINVGVFFSPLDSCIHLLTF